MYLINTSAWIDFFRKQDDRLVPYLESRGDFLQRLSLFRRLPLTESAVSVVAPVAHLMRKI